MSLPIAYQIPSQDDVFILQRNLGELNQENIALYREALTKTRDTGNQLMEALRKTQQLLKDESAEKDSYRNRYYVSTFSSVCLILVLGILYMTSECK